MRKSATRDGLPAAKQHRRPHWHAVQTHSDFEKKVAADPIAKAGPWYATVPRHSFNSHWLLGLTTPKQECEGGAFFAETIEQQPARRLLEDYGIRQVVTPGDGPAREYLEDYQERAHFGSLEVCELPGRTMKPYQPSTARHC